MTNNISKRLDKLERQALEGGRRREVVFLKDGEYIGNGKVLTEAEYQALMLEADVLTVEIVWPEGFDESAHECAAC